jgi:hypothetical protein
VPYLPAANCQLTPAALLKPAASRRPNPATPVAPAAAPVVLCVAVVEVDTSRALVPGAFPLASPAVRSYVEEGEGSPVDKNLAVAQHSSAVMLIWARVVQWQLPRRRRELQWTQVP